MPSPKHTLSNLQFTTAILLHGGSLMQPICRVAADQKAPINQIQNATIILVETFTTAVAANLSDNYLDVAAMLTGLSANNWTTYRLSRC